MSDLEKEMKQESEAKSQAESTDEISTEQSLEEEQTIGTLPSIEAVHESLLESDDSLGIPEIGEIDGGMSVGFSSEPTPVETFDSAKATMRMKIPDFDVLALEMSSNKADADALLAKELVSLAEEASEQEEGESDTNPNAEAYSASSTEEQATLVDFQVPTEFLENTSEAEDEGDDTNSELKAISDEALVEVPETEKPEEESS